MGRAGGQMARRPLAGGRHSQFPSFQGVGYFEAWEYSEVIGEPCSLEADFSAFAALTVMLGA